MRGGWVSKRSSSHTCIELLNSYIREAYMGLCSIMHLFC